METSKDRLLKWVELLSSAGGAHIWNFDFPKSVAFPDVLALCFGDRLIVRPLPLSSKLQYDTEILLEQRKSIYKSLQFHKQLKKRLKITFVFAALLSPEGRGHPSLFCTMASDSVYYCMVVFFYKTQILFIYMLQFPLINIKKCLTLRFFFSQTRSSTSATAESGFLRSPTAAKSNLCSSESNVSEMSHQQVNGHLKS